MKGIRGVKVGEEFIYMGKTLGKVKIDIMSVKGSPKLWVENALKTYKNPETVLSMLERYAADEKARHPFRAGVKMGNKSFFRNALGYLRNKAA